MTQWFSPQFGVLKHETATFFFVFLGVFQTALGDLAAHRLVLIEHVDDFFGAGVGRQHKDRLLGNNRDARTLRRDFATCNGENKTKKSESTYKVLI